MALFPLANLSGVQVPLRETQAVLEEGLRGKGLELVSGDAVEEFLARHRIRYTGGVEGSAAQAARAELGVDAILLAAAVLHEEVGVPRFGMAMRLVSAEERPAVLWMDEVSRTGADSPGLLDLGVVAAVPPLRETVVARLVRSLVAALAGSGPSITTCPTGRGFRPRILYHATRSVLPHRPSIAVAPFVNQTGREDAGELLAVAFVRELARRPGLEVLEPGVVRAEFIRHRIIMEGGISHETARLALGTLEVDVVLAGYVRTHREQPEPALEFTVLALQTSDNRVLWQSTSYARGGDGVFFFDWGRVSTTSGLACRMVRGAVDEMLPVLGPAERKGPGG